jgi:hypothetical protein
LLDLLSEKKVHDKKGREITTVAQHVKHRRFYKTNLYEMPVLGRLDNAVLPMLVTACASERNWSLWGSTFVPNRNALGQKRAEDLMFVRQEDAVGPKQPPSDRDAMVV